MDCELGVMCFRIAHERVNDNMFVETIALVEPLMNTPE